MNVIIGIDKQIQALPQSPLIEFHDLSKVVIKEEKGQAHTDSTENIQQISVDKSAEAHMFMRPFIQDNYIKQACEKGSLSAPGILDSEFVYLESAHAIEETDSFPLDLTYVFSEEFISCAKFAGDSAELSQWIKITSQQNVGTSARIIMNRSGEMSDEKNGLCEAALEGVPEMM